MRLHTQIYATLLHTGVRLFFYVQGLSRFYRLDFLVRRIDLYFLQFVAFCPSSLASPFAFSDDCKSSRFSLSSSPPHPAPVVSAPTSCTLAHYLLTYFLHWLDSVVGSVVIIRVDEQMYTNKLTFLVLVPFSLCLRVEFSISPISRECGYARLAFQRFRTSRARRKTGRVLDAPIFMTVSLLSRRCVPLSHDPPRGWGCSVQGESRSTSHTTPQVVFVTF